MIKRIFHRIFLTCFFVAVFCSAFSQLNYVENKGQWNEKVLYKLRLNEAALFLEENCVTWALTDPHSMAHSHAHHGCEEHNNNLLKDAHAYKVHFVGANKNPQIQAQNPQLDYVNYFIGNNPKNWASNVKLYEKVLYTDIYNQIDLLYYTHEKGVKYDFIVKPSGNYKDIILEYEGVDNIKIKDNQLVVTTSVNEVIELQPFAYQIFDGEKIPIRCNYKLKKNKLSFSFPNGFDNSRDLIIDPSLVFSTYTGSTGDNWGFTATWDYNDNVYSGGIVFDIGYPTSTGAYQINFAGGTAPIAGSSFYANGCDVGIIKYNANGTQRLYATYLGGSNGQEMPHSLIVTEENELIIMGTTGADDFPVSANAFQTTFAGGDSVVYDNVIGFNDGVDIFVTKLSEDGTQLLASTYVGGSGNDGLNFKPHMAIHYVLMHGNDSLYYNYADGARGEVIVDGKNNVYVGTNTFSTDFPSGINPGYQTTSGGKQDGIVFKLNPDLSQLIWSSYLGGNEDDAIFSMDLSPNEDVLVTGATVSHNFPVTSGAYNTSHNGGSTDAFVSKLNNMGNTLLASSYFGSSAFDNAYFVRSDKFGHIFITGLTKAPANALVYNATYNHPNSGQFISKFNSNLSSLVWSTRFGTDNGRPNISITAFAVDICNRIYLTGCGREWVSSPYNAQWDTFAWEDDYGTKGMEITADAIQTETDGQDFYVMVLSEDASELEYASFFGELHYDGCSYSGHDHVDGGTSRFDKKGHIIQSVCSSCGACQQFPTAPNPGVWSSTNNSSNCNNAVFKIRIIENLADASFDPVPAGCAPYTVNFQNTSQGTSFLWDFGDGSPTSTALNPNHTYTVGGEYTVTLIVGDPLSCNFYDTIQRTFSVIEPGLSTLPDLEICPGQSIVIGPEGNYPAGTTFSWVQGSNLNNTTIKNPVATPTETTEYILIATGICVDSLIQTVSIYEPDIDLYASADTTICPGGTAHLHATSTGDVDSWAWSTSTSFNSILSNSQNLTVSPSQNTTYYVRVKEDVCNTFLIESVNVNVHQFNYSIVPDQILCPGDETHLTITNNKPSDILTYSWQPSSTIISGANTNSPLVKPTTPTTYTVTITNQMGCTTTNSVYVDIDNISWSPPDLTHNPCFGNCLGTATVSANGIAPYSYAWSGNPSQNETASNLCAGTYTVTVTDGNNCTSETSVTINQPPQLLASFTSVQHPVCDGIGYGSATVYPTGGTTPYTYSWSNGGGSNATNNTCFTGQNYVTITDNNGCQRVDSVFMTSPSDLTSSLSNVVHISCYGFCDGEIHASVSLGTPPYSYLWSNDSTSTSITELCQGVYTLTVIDANNCVTHQYQYIYEPPELLVTTQISEEIKCFGETGSVSASAIGGTYPHSYNWSQGSTQTSLDNVSAGIYQVTVLDYNNCKTVSEIELTQPPLLEMNNIVTNMLCTGVCNGSIHTELIGGTPPYYYSWSNGSQKANIENLCEDEYELTIKDKNNCSLTRNFTIINQDYIPDLSVAASDTIIYRGQSVNLLALSSSSGYYLWDYSKFLSNIEISNPIATPDDTTMFYVKFTDLHGCRIRDSIKIYVKEVICGDPYIYVPNAFTPNNDGKNDYFKPYYPYGLVTEVFFVVYDRWGNIVFQTDEIWTKGWDGTYRGEQLTSDVYVYFLRARCLNGEEYSHKGNVTLLR